MFQALPTVFASLDKCKKNIVIVISPLINLMKDQVSRLSFLGVSAILLSDICSVAEIIKGGEWILVRAPDHVILLRNTPSTSSMSA